MPSFPALLANAAWQVISDVSPPLRSHRLHQVYKQLVFVFGPWPFPVYYCIVIAMVIPVISVIVITHIHSLVLIIVFFLFHFLLSLLLPLLYCLYFPTSRFFSFISLIFISFLICFLSNKFLYCQILYLNIVLYLRSSIITFSFLILCFIYIILFLSLFSYCLLYSINIFIIIYYCLLHLLFYYKTIYYY